MQPSTHPRLVRLNQQPPLSGSPQQGSSHPISKAALDRFAQGADLGSLRIIILQHLLAGCRECRQHLAVHWQGPRGAAKKRYERAFQRSTRDALEVFEHSQPPL
jgi:hypothetical protein